MPAIALYRCSSCKKFLDALDANSTIGKPFIQCKHCQTFNVIADGRNEWSLMDSAGRFGVYARVVLVGAFGGGGFAVLITELQSRYYPGLPIPFLPAAVVLVCLVGWWWWREVATVIAESNARMNDPAYVALLAKLGVLNRR